MAKELIGKLTSPTTHYSVQHDPKTDKFYEQHRHMGIRPEKTELSRDDVLRKLTMHDEKHINKKNVEKALKEHELPHWKKD
jgi:hypothetical protein